MTGALYASPYGGTRYHRSPACVGLNSFCMSMLTAAAPLVSRPEIERRRLTPCRICNPPPLLTLAPADPSQPDATEGASACDAVEATTGARCYLGPGHDGPHNGLSHHPGRLHGPAHLVTWPEDCLCLGVNVCSTCDDRRLVKRSPADPSQPGSGQ